MDNNFGEGFDINLVIEKIVKYTDYILRFHWLAYKNNACLKRSLVLFHFLRKYGIEVHICLGVKRVGALRETNSENFLKGHAWLTYNGDIFLEKNSLKGKHTFKTTYCFP
jgi:hypothetical protein